MCYVFSAMYPQTHTYFDDNGKLSIERRAVEIAKDRGLTLEVFTWNLHNNVNRVETDSDLYTGPDGHVWKMILRDSATDKLVQSVGFTDKEINFCKSDFSKEVEERLQEAIGKVAT